MLASKDFVYSISAITQPALTLTTYFWAPKSKTVGIWWIKGAFVADPVTCMTVGSNVPRILKDWLPAFLDYTSGTEAPRVMHFWAGVSAIAGCLRRRVWIDMKRFCWYPNFYIIFVAPPGVISKTTTMDLGLDLLKKVPGIKFGPDVITWPALVEAFAAAGESFQWGEDWCPMSAITLASGELGNLINPQDRDMINLYITLWDGKKTFEKVTKTSGNDMVEAPWINMIGCTTPHWIADNMPAATVGGGFTSRCVFVYGEKKEALIAYPDEFTREDHEERSRALIHDLEHISTQLVGPYTIEESARAWGRAWYERMWGEGSKRMEAAQIDGYLARKQTHMHKLALIISASQRDELVITREDLELAGTMLDSTEKDLDKVFSRIGRSEESLQAERFIQYIKFRGQVKYADAYQHVHTFFSDFRDFEGMLTGCIRSGTIEAKVCGPNIETDLMLIYRGQ